MTAVSTVIPAGMIMTISSGEYSDYSVMGVFRAIKDIDAEKLRDEYLSLEEERDEDGDYRWDADRLFLAWLARTGFIETVESRELYLGQSYDRLADMEVLT